MKILFIIMTVILLSGCCPKTYVILPDPYIELQERQAKQQALEYQKQSLKLNEEIAQEGIK